MGIAAIDESDPPDLPVICLAISQRVGVGGAVVGGFRVRHTAGRSDRSLIGDRTRGGGTNCAGSFVGNGASSGHGDGVVNVAGPTGSEPGCSPGLGGGIGDTGEVAWEDIVNDYAANFTRPTFVTTIV